MRSRWRGRRRRRGDCRTECPGCARPRRLRQNTRSHARLGTRPQTQLRAQHAPAGASAWGGSGSSLHCSMFLLPARGGGGGGGGRAGGARGVGGGGGGCRPGGWLIMARAAAAAPTPGGMPLALPLRCHNRHGACGGKHHPRCGVVVGAPPGGRAPPIGPPGAVDVVEVAQRRHRGVVCWPPRVVLRCAPVPAHEVLGDSKAAFLHPAHFQDVSNLPRLAGGARLGGALPVAGALATPAHGVADQVQIRQLGRSPFYFGNRPGLMIFALAKKGGSA